MDGYQPYEYKDKTMLIERYLVLGKQTCSENEYDVFDMQLNQAVFEGVKKIAEHGYAEFGIHNELSREGFSSFKYFGNAKNSKIFLYSEVYSKTKTKILLCIQANKSKSKLWINNKCLAINQSYSYYYLTAVLIRGKNTLVFEQFSPVLDTTFSIQLRNYRFEMSDDARALSHVNMKHLFQIDPLMLIYEPFYRPTESIYRFMYLKNDNELKPDYRVDIHDSSTGFVRTFNARIGEIVEVEVNELRALHKETLRHEWIGCVFKDREGKDVKFGPCIFLSDFTKKSDEINDKLLLLSKEIPAAASNYVMVNIARSNVIRNSGDYATYYWLTCRRKDILQQLETGNFPYDYYKFSGTHEFSIYSALDDSYIRMYARIPENYDKDRAYPVFISLATSNDGYFSWHFPPETELSESCLCFDVTGRGFTGGSYIAEASIWEIYNWIRKNYKIDEDRIYVLGQSNGGYATWAFAQNYPHIPAAIYPHIGYPQIETIDNASNIPAYQTVSPKDDVFAGRENEVKQKVSKYGNYHEIRFEEMIHTSFVHYIAHRGILNQMLTAKRDRFPHHIIFSTCRNRHLESFWIKLHGIEKGKKFARIKVVIENEHLIKVTVSGVIGITITLPPQIKKGNFNISINNKAFNFEKPEKNQIHFIRNETWTTTDNIVTPDFRKGTGLLDVYMDSLRITVPDDASETLMKAADNFSKPYTNGIDPQIYVNYPVYKESNVPNHIFSHNLVIFDICMNSDYAKRFNSKLKIRYDLNGCEYQGNRYDGDYVVMQVLPNPYDNRLSMLVISTNNERLLGKCLFTRKIIIPYYFTGIHPYWNNEAIIFMNYKYYGIYEWDMDMKEIN